jgi:hypothetical protein
VSFFSNWTAQRDENGERLKQLPQRYCQYDLVLAWEVRGVGADTVVDGVVKNVRYAHLEDLEISVALLDQAGEAGERAVCFIIPRQLRLDQAASFSIKLPVRVEPGARLRFNYRYQSTEDGAGNRQSFDVEVL